MLKINALIKAYIAGFLDGDGSVYVRLKPHKDHRYKFQVCPYIVFYQSSQNRKILEKIDKFLRLGYLRDRNDGMTEYVIGNYANIIQFMNWIEPYVISKKQHFKLMRRILEQKELIKNKNDFIKLVKLIDQFQKINYSKKRLNNSLTVKQKLITP